MATQASYAAIHPDWEKPRTNMVDGYSLEMTALRRLDRKSFGVLMSLEPAVAACAGLVLLGERISAVQWLAIGLVIAASVGITVGSRRSAPQAAILET